MKYWRHADCLKQYRHCAYPLVGLKEGKIIFVITITESVGLFWKKDMGLCVGKIITILETSDFIQPSY